MAGPAVAKGLGTFGQNIKQARVPVHVLAPFWYNKKQGAAGREKGQRRPPQADAHAGGGKGK